MHSPATLSYFCAPPGHFWEWEEDGMGNQAAVWPADRSTLLVREELNELLGTLVGEGLPPLGAVLLVIAAVSGNWNASKVRAHLWDAAQRATGHEDVPASIAKMWRRVGHGLQQIHQLPEDLRANGPARQGLLRTVFEGAFNRLPASLSQEMLGQFLETPYLNVFQQRTPELNGIARLLRDLSVLEKAFDRLPMDGLEQRLRTGVDHAVSAVEELPLEEHDATPLPEVPANLLEALEQEGGEPAQIAGLVRRLGAILHVPKPVVTQEELPVGGVSDITNRGDPSRLLMTELAWDDMTFAVRLAQGEALYTRRESPPAEPPPQRLILLDTGIFMWGKPRLFGLGAALALLRQKGAEASGGEVFTLGADGFISISLNSVSDVRAQLSRMEPQPHPGPALAVLCDTVPQSFTAETEVFLVTHPAALEAVALLPVWQTLASRVPLHSLTVDRSGELILARHSLAGSRVLSQARVDLDRLLGGGRVMDSPAATLTHGRGLLPRFYRMHPWPLYQPVAPLPGKAFQLEGKGYVGISTANTVCWWGARDLARVLYPTAPSRDLIAVAGDPEDSKAVIFLFRTADYMQLVLLTAWLDGSRPSGTITLRAKAAPIRSIRVQSGALIVYQNTVVQAFRLQDGHMIAWTQPSATTSGTSLWFDGEKFHPHGNPSLPSLIAGSSTVPRVSNRRHRLMNIFAAGFGLAGQFVIQKEKGRVYELSLRDNGGLDWIPNATVKASLQHLQPLDHPDWPDHDLRHAEFPDGRRVVYDPRGFLHIIDSGVDGQELSIVLVKGSTAAWQGKGFHYGDRGLLCEESLGASTSLKSICRRLFRPLPGLKHSYLAEKA
jgi:hypothetical protein